MKQHDEYTPTMRILVAATLLAVSLCSFTATAQSDQKFEVTPQSEQLFLHIPLWAFDKTLYWYTSEEGLSYISFSKDRSRVKILSPILSASFGKTFPVTRRNQAASPFPEPVVAELEGTIDDSGRIKIDISSLLLHETPGISGFGPARNGVRPFVFEGAKEEQDGIDLWGTFRSRQAAGGSGYSYGGATQTLRVGMSLIVPTDALMVPRRFDHRMGFFFDNTFAENGNRSFLHPYDAAIRRWRLEPVLPGADTSDPVEPIKFYFSPEVPEFAKPALRQAAEDWEEAFVEAGFTNAVELLEVPGDVMARGYTGLRYPIVSWSDQSISRRTITPEFSGILAGGGASVVTDIRTGEIIWSEVTAVWPPETAFQFYIAACGINDPRTFERSLHNEIRIDIMQAIATHEFGHAFGLRDGNFGEYSYTVQNIRNPEFLDEFGFSPSVMNYTRCNYVAQPGDDVLVPTLMQRVGPADRYQISWGYSYFDSTMHEQAVSDRLNEIVGKKNDMPWLAYVRYAAYPKAGGPQSMNEAVDVVDPLEASRLGLQNHRRLLETLPHLLEEGVFSPLEAKQIYFQALVHWEVMMIHPMTLIGGYNEDYTDIGTRYSPVAAQVQRDAIEFLMENAFQSKDYELYHVNSDLFLPGEVRRHASYLQSFLMAEMLSVERLDRISFTQKVDEAEALSIQEYLHTLREGVWGEIFDRRPVVSFAKQEIQEGHVLALLNALRSHSEKATNQFYLMNKLIQPNVNFQEYGRSGWRAAVQYDLEILLGDIDRALKKTKDASTHGHLSRMRRRINSGLYGAE